MLVILRNILRNRESLREESILYEILVLHFVAHCSQEAWNTFIDSPLLLRAFSSLTRAAYLPLSSFLKLALNSQ